MEYKGRCMRCRKNDMLMKDVKIVSMGGTRKAAKGKCAKCDCNMYKILSKEQVAQAAKAA